MFVFDHPEDRRPISPVVRIIAQSGDSAPSRAFPAGENVTLSLFISRVACAYGVSLLFYDGKETGTAPVLSRQPAVYQGLRDGYDVYSVTLSPNVGLYFFVFEILTAYGVLYTSENAPEAAELRNHPDHAVKSQLLIYQAAYLAPDYSRNVMYHIFVDRFCKGTPLKASIADSAQARRDTVLIDDWNADIPEYAEIPGEPVKNNTFFGGNLWGVAEKLDDIRALGADVLYLSPIFRAYSNHKYDTGDYFTVDEAFGGEAALRHLIAETHKRGMKIILDGVFNHTGDDSRYFNRYGTYEDVGAYQSTVSEYSDFYHFENFPDKYECWWGIEILPRLQNDNPRLREFFCGENGVIRHYLRMGIDGWRLDVADELPSDFLSDIKAAAEKEKSGSIIIGEVWEDASNKIAYGVRREYFLGKQLDSVMNYPLRDAVIRFARHGDALPLAHVIREQTLRYPPEQLYNLMNFLGTHDTVRILTVLGGEHPDEVRGSVLSKMRLSGDEREIGKRRLILSFAVICALYGMPSVFYGDEAGMEGGRDPFNRRTFPWGHEDKDLTAEFRALLRIRKETPALTKGNTTVLSEKDGLFILKRTLDGHTVFFLANAGDTEKTLHLGNSTKFISLCSGKTHQNTYFLSPLGFDFLTAEE